MGHNTELGRRGEQIAARHLEARGLQVVERNWRCQHGEIDLVARDGRDTVIVEVKTRSSNDFGHPFEAITPQKLGRLRRLASAWCLHAGGPASPIGRVRIDAVAVLLPDGSPAVIEHLVGLS
jgi:putative endonuclease